jgi:hypothetical protein
VAEGFGDAALERSGDNLTGAGVPAPLFTLERPLAQAGAR